MHINICVLYIDMVHTYISKNRETTLPEHRDLVGKEAPAGVAHELRPRGEGAAEGSVSAIWAEGSTCKGPEAGAWCVAHAERPERGWCSKARGEGEA